MYDRMTNLDIAENKSTGRRQNITKLNLRQKLTHAFHSKYVQSLT